MLKLAHMWQLFAQRRPAGRESPHLPHLTRAAGGSGAAGDPLEHQVESAMREWHAAQAHFGTVSGVAEPDLVDHAIYNLEAAQRKYVYLLRQVQRARGILSTEPGAGYQEE